MCCRELVQNVLGATLFNGQLWVDDDMFGSLSLEEDEEVAPGQVRQAWCWCV